MNRLKDILSFENLIWSAGFLNVLAMALQLYTLLAAGDASGLSLPMLAIFIFVQLTFCLVGYRDKVKAQFWSMLASGVITDFILLYALALEHYNSLWAQWLVGPIALIGPVLYTVLGIMHIEDARSKRERDEERVNYHKEEEERVAHRKIATVLDPNVDTYEPIGNTGHIRVNYKDGHSIVMDEKGYEVGS